MRPTVLALLLAGCGFYNAKPPAPVCEAPLDDGGCLGWLYPETGEVLWDEGDGGWRDVTGLSGGGFFTSHGAFFSQGDADSSRCCGPVQLGNDEEALLDALGDNGWPRGAMAGVLRGVRVQAVHSGQTACGAPAIGCDVEEGPASDSIAIDVDAPSIDCWPEGIYVHELAHAIRHQLTGDGDATHADLSVWRAVERVAGEACAGGGL